MPRLISAIRSVARVRREDGVIAIVLALLAGSGILIAFLALVVDIGAMQVERRELQNGAEAAAVSAAYDCSFPGSALYPCGSTAGAISLASANARDGAAGVNAGDLCGQGNAALTPCVQPRTVRNCPNTPSAAKWVQVTASTKTGGGSSFLPQFFMQYIPGIGPKTISACAQAAWGPPAGSLGTIFPMALQWSCWQAQVAGNNAYGPTTYSYAASTLWERYFKMSNGNNAGCLGSADISAGFGWLSIGGTVACSNVNGAGYTYDAWVPIDTGNDMTNDCKAILPAILGKPLALPIYDCTWQNGVWYGSRYPTGAACDTLTAPTTGTGRYFHLAGFGSFLMSGYFYGSGNQSYDGAMGAAPCVSNDRCFYGWFTQQTLLTSGNIGDTAPYMGLNVVQLVG